MKRTVWQRTAETWAQKTSAILTSDAGHARNDDERWLVGYDASRFVWRLLWEADTCVALIPDDPDMLEDLQRQAQALARRLRDRILAAKLDGVAGRTPEETAAFRAKADELRSRS